MSRIKTTKAGRAVLKAVEPIVVKAGGRCWIEDPVGNRGHQRLVVELNGAQRFSPLSGTPRLIDQTIKHKMADVRKLIQELTAGAAA